MKHGAIIFCLKFKNILILHNIIKFRRFSQKWVSFVVFFTIILWDILLVKGTIQGFILYYILYGELVLYETDFYPPLMVSTYLPPFNWHHTNLEWCICDCLNLGKREGHGLWSWQIEPMIGFKISFRKIVHFSSLLLTKGSITGTGKKGILIIIIW